MRSRKEGIGRVGEDSSGRGKDAKVGAEGGGLLAKVECEWVLKMHAARDYFRGQVSRGEKVGRRGWGRRRRGREGWVASRRKRRRCEGRGSVELLSRKEGGRNKW